MTDPAATSDIKRMRLRYAGTCACGTDVAAGTQAGYDRVAKKAVCPSCLDAGLTRPPEPPASELSKLPAETRSHQPAVLSGMAGGSAQAEFERRSARREERVRAAHPRLGGLLLALNGEPQSTRAWASGARGERVVGARLDNLAGDGVLTLHDRRIPRSRANIDHLAVGPTGVFVIDAKRYDDSKVEVRRSGGWRSPVVEKLFVGGRDRTKLVLGLASQVAAVYEALEDLDGYENVRVQPVLAFVDALLPMFGTIEIAGVPVLGPKGTAKLVRQPGPLGVVELQQLHTHLAAKLPAY